MTTIVRIALATLGFVLLGGGTCAYAAAPSVGPMPQTVVYDHCSWDHPGVNPFMGDVVAALDRYRDMPPDVRARLQARMEKRDYDDLVSIRRDSIDGRGGYDYGQTISDMHFGTHQLCRSVTRSSWSPQMQERGLVYCDSGQCILVPTVCRNVSRITRSGVGPDAAAAPPLLAAAPADDALPVIDYFGPTGAGLPAGTDMGAAGLTGGGDEAPVPFFTNAFVGPEVAVGGFVAETGPGVGTESGTFSLPAGGERAGAVAAVPEPGTWALVLLGLGGVMLAAYRRR